MLWRGVGGWRAGVAAIAAVTLLVAACNGGGGGDKPNDSPSPAVDAPCALDTAQQFLEQQEALGFGLYCPTFLPEGYTLDLIDAPAEAETPFLHVVFKDAEGNKITLLQGYMGVEWRDTVVQPYEGLDTQLIEYAGIAAALYPTVATDVEGFAIGPIVIAQDLDGPYQYISTAPRSDDVLKQISEGMRLVESSS